MYNTALLRLITILAHGAATPTGYSAGGFGTTYLGNSYRADGWGSLKSATGYISLLTLLGTG